MYDLEGGDDKFDRFGDAPDRTDAMVPKRDEDAGGGEGWDVGDVFCESPWAISM